MQKIKNSRLEGVAWGDMSVQPHVFGLKKIALAWYVGLPSPFLYFPCGLFRQQRTFGHVRSGAEQNSVGTHSLCARVAPH